MVDTSNSPEKMGALVELDYSARRETMIPVREEELKQIGNFSTITTICCSLCSGFFFYGLLSIRYVPEQVNWWNQDAVILPISFSIVCGILAGLFHHNRKNMVRTILNQASKKKTNLT